ncbi:mediator of RNA polymerase ii transcription subunit 31 [Anaeramoeba ignava]|uniref:Mediator of RNA polymerase II transcription subunit 31 n=1 Tax=Anaeramoeba ignava TaxID=1746090 RepID=A0A9Q0LH15_ANAIG|nr:mediator of RNA polymerase ii transcription subunit 31 [Anaeramoeba ignava]
MNKSEENERRFTAELEFVQCLGNPTYLNYLAKSRYFKQKEFINYLAYLLYWKEPEYAKYVIYPHCLYILDLLQNEEFRESLDNPEVTDYIHKQQYYYWRYYKWNRQLNTLNDKQNDVDSLIQSQENEKEKK